MSRSAVALGIAGALLATMIPGVGQASPIQALASSAVGTAASTSALASTASPSKLVMGGKIIAGRSISTAQYSLSMLADGNAVMRGNGRVLWSTGTAGKARGGYLTVRSDGSLAVRDRTGRTVWATRPAGAGAYLVVLADGDLSLRSRAGAVVWRSYRPGAQLLTAGASLRAGQFIQARATASRLTMHADGRLVQTGSYGGVVWSRACAPGSVFSVRADGSLTVTTPTGLTCWRLPALRGTGVKLTMTDTDSLSQTAALASRAVTPWSSLLAYRNANTSRLVFDRVNAQRVAAGLKALRWNPQLAAAAQGHTRAMAGVGVLTHQVSGQAPLGERVRAAGYRWRYASENIGAHVVTDYTGGLALQDVMVTSRSLTDPRRVNVLNSRAVDAGVGVQVVGGTLWLTVVFGQPA